jgi:hypothetical protein
LGVWFVLSDRLGYQVVFSSQIEVAVRDLLGKEGIQTNFLYSLISGIDDFWT